MSSRTSSRPRTSLRTPPLIVTRSFTSGLLTLLQRAKYTLHCFQSKSSLVWKYGMEYGMEDFWHGMEMEWKKIARMEYEKIIFHSIQSCPGRSHTLICFLFRKATGTHLVSENTLHSNFSANKLKAKFLAPKCRKLEYFTAVSQCQMTYAYKMLPL